MWISGRIASLALLLAAKHSLPSSSGKHFFPEMSNEASAEAETESQNLAGSQNVDAAGPDVDDGDARQDISQQRQLGAMKSSRDFFTRFRTLGDDAQTDAVASLHFKNKWQETEWVKAENYDELTAITQWAMTDRAADEDSMHAIRATIDKIYREEDEDDPTHEECAKFCEDIVDVLAAKKIAPPDAAYEQFPRKVQVEETIQWTPGLRLQPARFIADCLKRKFNSVDARGRSESSLGLEDVQDSDSDEETTSAKDGKKKKIRVGKGKKQSAKMTIETLTQMSQTAGVSRPVADKYEGAQLVQVLTEKEVTKLVTMFAFAEHLAKPEKTSVFLEALEQMKGLQPTALAKMKQAFKSNDNKKTEKRDRQYGNMYIMCGDMMRMMVAAYRTAEQPNLEEDFLLEAEKAAAILTRLGVHEVQKVAIRPIEVFCDTVGMLRTAEVERMVTDPSMMSNEKREEFRKQLLEAYQLKQAMMTITDPKKSLKFRPLLVYVRTRPEVATMENVFTNAHSLQTSAGTSRRADLALTRTGSPEPRRRIGAREEEKAKAAAEAEVKARVKASGAQAEAEAVGRAHEAGEAPTMASGSSTFTVRQLRGLMEELRVCAGDRSLTVREGPAMVRKEERTFLLGWLDDFEEYGVKYIKWAHSDDGGRCLQSGVAPPSLLPRWGTLSDYCRVSDRSSSDLSKDVAMDSSAPDDERREADTAGKSQREQGGRRFIVSQLPIRPSPAQEYTSGEMAEERWRGLETPKMCATDSAQYWDPRHQNQAGAVGRAGATNKETGLRIRGGVVGRGRSAPTTSVGRLLGRVSTTVQVVDAQVENADGEQLRVLTRSRPAKQYRVDHSGRQEKSAQKSKTGSGHGLTTGSRESARPKGTNVLLSYFPYSGDAQEAGTARHEALGRKQALSKTCSQAGRSKDSQRADRTGRTVCVVGPPKNVLSVLGSGTAPLPTESQSLGDGAGPMDVETLAGEMHVYGPDGCPRNRDEVHERCDEIVQGVGIPRGDKGGRLDRVPPPRPTRRHDDMLHDHEDVDQTGCGVERREVRFQVTPTSEMARNDLLLGSGSVLAGRRQGDETSEDGGDVTGETEQWGWFTEQHPISGDIFSVWRQKGHPVSATTRTSHWYDDSSDRGSGFGADTGDGSPNAAVRTDLGQALGVGSRSASDGDSTCSTSAGCASMRRMDGGLQPQPASQDLVERQTVLLSPSDSGGVHGCVRVAEGSLGSSGSRERLPGDILHNAFRESNDLRAHHVAGVGGSGRRLVGGDLRAGVSELHSQGQNRRDSSTEILDVHGRQDMVLHECGGDIAVGVTIEAHHAGSGSCGRQDQSGGRAEQTHRGNSGIRTVTPVLRQAEQYLGSFRAGRVRCELERAATEVLDDDKVRPECDGLRRADVSSSLGDKTDLSVPTSSQTVDNADTATCGKRACLSSNCVASVAVRAAGDGSANDCCVASLDGGLPGAVATATGLWGAPSAGGPKALVDPKQMALMDWSELVTRCRSARGFPPALAQHARLHYKTGRDGDHLDRPYSFMVATLNELYPTGYVDMSDAVIAVILSRRLGSESANLTLLSALRVIGQKCFGGIAQLDYDKETTNQAKALGRRKKAIAPRYSKPVYFGPSLHTVVTVGASPFTSANGYGLWMSIIVERMNVSHLPETSKKRLNVLRNHALFLERHDAISRSDDETKYDVRSPSYFRCYDSDGCLQTHSQVSHNLDAVLVRAGGCVHRNYLNPKDPRKKGKWSDTVETRPLRLALLVDEQVPHLQTLERVGWLCSVRVKRDYYRCMEAQDAMACIPSGSCWVSVGQTDVNGDWLALQPVTIASLIVKRAALGGLKVNKNERSHADDGADTLAGHFLRGHAASVAYYLATQHGASWCPFLGIDRARHTVESFMKNYSRGVHPALVARFLTHKHKASLRFEEAARL